MNLPKDMEVERPVKSNVTPRVMSRIVNAERLISIYGEWPDFHDSEVTDVGLDRGNHMTVVATNDWKNRIAPSLTAKVITFDFRFGDTESRKYRP